MVFLINIGNYFAFIIFIIHQPREMFELNFFIKLNALIYNFIKYKYIHTLFELQTCLKRKDEMKYSIIGFGICK